MRYQFIPEIDAGGTILIVITWRGILMHSGGYSVNDGEVSDGGGPSGHLLANPLFHIGVGSEVPAEIVGVSH